MNRRNLEMKNTEAILVTPGKMEIQDCPVPEPKDNEVLVKVEYVGICGSDIHGFQFGPFIPPKDPNQKIGRPPQVQRVSVMIVEAPPPKSSGRIRSPPRSETCTWP